MKNKKKMLIDLNKKHSQMYLAQRMERLLYKAKHPTNVVVFKCMDGRVHMPVVTQTPLGIMKPFRNLGGKFNMGWPLLNEVFDKSVKDAASQGNRTLAIINYHFSKGDKKRGCAGFHYDKQKSIRFTEDFRKQILKIYGVDNRVVYPILVGLETDFDSLIFHGEKGKKIDVSILKNSKKEDLFETFRSVYPSMPKRILRDLVPLVKGNMKLIAKNKKKAKAIEQMVHGEWIMAIGKGFEWLHTPNLALIVGPYDPNIGEPIRTAASIIESNFNAKRIKGGFVLLTSAIYEDAAEKNRTRARTLFLNKLSKEIIEEYHPKILPKMHSMAVVLNASDMKMEIVK